MRNQNGGPKGPPFIVCQPVADTLEATTAAHYQGQLGFRYRTRARFIGHFSAICGPWAPLKSAVPYREPQRVGRSSVEMNTVQRRIIRALNKNVRFTRILLIPRGGLGFRIGLGHIICVRIVAGIKSQPPQLPIIIGNWVFCIAPEHDLLGISVQFAARGYR